MHASRAPYKRDVIAIRLTWRVFSYEVFSLITRGVVGALYDVFMIIASFANNRRDCEGENEVARMSRELCNYYDFNI